jgi:uncharacterized OsmC-like protein
VLPEIKVSTEQVRDCEFRVRFENTGFAELTMDGPGAMGHGAGPSPSQLLAASIGNCSCMSLLLAARKQGLRINTLRAEVKTRIVLDEQGRHRVPRVEVTLVPKFERASPEQIRACLALSEELCAVTNSVREGIDVSVVCDSSALSPVNR